jgi:hypothetical protein
VRRGGRRARRGARRAGRESGRDARGGGRARRRGWALRTRCSACAQRRSGTLPLPVRTETERLGASDEVVGRSDEVLGGSCEVGCGSDEVLGGNYKVGCGSVAVLGVPARSLCSPAEAVSPSDAVLRASDERMGAPRWMRESPADLQGSADGSPGSPADLADLPDAPPGSRAPWVGSLPPWLDPPARCVGASTRRGGSPAQRSGALAQEQGSFAGELDALGSAGAARGKVAGTNPRGVELSTGCQQPVDNTRPPLCDIPRVARKQAPTRCPRRDGGTSRGDLPQRFRRRKSLFRHFVAIKKAALGAVLCSPLVLHRFCRTMSAPRPGFVHRISPGAMTLDRGALATRARETRPW